MMMCKLQFFTTGLLDIVYGWVKGLILVDISMIFNGEDDQLAPQFGRQMCIEPIQTVAFTYVGPLDSQVGL